MLIAVINSENVSRRYRLPRRFNEWSKENVKTRTTRSRTRKEKRKSENADHTRQIEDDTKQIADDTKQIEDDTKQIEDDTKQNKRRQSSWDPNSVGLGLGYFERANFFVLYIFDFVKTLTHEKHCIQISKHVTNHGRIMHMEKKVDKWRKPRS
ncbi:hypothetical protein T06_1630, partial [Trichinella sp. T6]